MRTRYVREQKDRIENKKPLTKEQWLLTKKYFGYRCAYCGAKVKLEQDHLRALSHGGHKSLENIVPACRSCNARKNNQSFDKWYKAQSFFDNKRLAKIQAFILTEGQLVNAGKYQ